MNLEYLIAEEDTYPDHGEKSTNGAKRSPGRRDVRDLLREIQGLDGHIQRGDDTVLTSPSSRVVSHGSKSTKYEGTL